MIRRLWMLCFVALMGTVLALPVRADTVPEKYEGQFFARVYLSETEAVRLQKRRPGDRVDTTTVTLSDTALNRIRRRQRVRMFTDTYRVYRLSHPGDSRPYRFAVFLQQPGQHEHIDLMYGIDADGTVHRIDLLVYREPYGGEVRSRRFMRQFEGESLETSQFRVNLDVVHVVGATISSQSVARGTRKVLAILRLKGLIPR